jgi:hypothetical protein
MELLPNVGTYERKKRTDYTGQPKTRDLTARSRPFVGWDGEGFTTDDGIHHYALFGNSRGERVSGGRVSWRNVFRLLFATPKECINVIYAGTYDVVMMFKDHPQKVQILKGATVNIENYRVQFLRSKFLKITDKETRQTRTLYDVFTFFGSSFVKACREYLGDSDLLREIETMKAQRNTFDITDMEGDVEQYMTQELAMLVELCNQLRDMLDKVGIHPASWHGPGSVASQILKTHGVKDKRGEQPDTFIRDAESAYYGGRFEQFQRGHANAPVWQYDIRSAYPAAMTHLPNLDGVTWNYINRRHGHESYKYDVMPYGLYHVEYRGDYVPIGSLPWRSAKGNIYFPHWANGWYWGVEIPLHMVQYITECWEPYGITDERPFAFVAEMYRQRAALKVAKQPHQLALKLALNSLYGKLAQSKGAQYDKHKGWAKPPFHQIMWAGWITAYTRRMIRDAMSATDPANIVAAETDSVFSLVPLDLPLGTALGQWDCTELEDLVYLQSGVSLVKSEGDWQFKTRGFTMRNSGEHTYQVWSDKLDVFPVDRISMTVNQTRFVTDPRRTDFGRWVNSEHRLTLGGNLLEKRIHIPCGTCDDGVSMANRLHPLVVPPIPYGPTLPYPFVWNGDLNPFESMMDDSDGLTLDLEFR